MIHLGDITKIDGKRIDPIDVIVGGSPCQDLSVAGKRAGLAGERSGLYMEQIKLTKELRQQDAERGKPAHICRPRYFIWENVPGAFSSKKGEDFAAVLEEVIRVIEPKAPSVSVPEKGWPTAGCIYDEMGRWSVAWRVHDAQFWGVPQRRRRIALVADFGGLSAPEVLFERKGLRGDPAQSGDAREGTAADAEGSSGSAISFQERGGKPGDGETVCTITGDHENRVTDYTALLTMQGFGDYKENGVASACKSRDYKDATDLVYQAEVFGQYQFGNYSPGCATLRAQSGGIENLVTRENAPSALLVRRLTPLEWERLQGYPDGWTNIGEWVDSKGKRRDSSDSARYKALGNSIALPFWHWLMRRISAQYVGNPTLGSLFDGIGGFPLCWERINGKGTALWASEIEEFPIAVTKYHFGG